MSAMGGKRPLAIVVADLSLGRAADLDPLAFRASTDPIGGRLFIRKLKPGERASETADRVYIGRLEGGRISWTGSVDADGKTVSGASPADFANIQEAETDAIAWARALGATELQIEGPNA